MATYMYFSARQVGPMNGRAVENRYCSRCRRTEKFQRTADLMCLTCGKRLVYRRKAG